MDPNGSCRFSGFAMWTKVVVDDTDPGPQKFRGLLGLAWTSQVLM